MMSDEETVDSQTLKRRRPEWRSAEFNMFMDLLDQRSYTSSKHPRKVRVIGSPLKCPPPLGTKEWMSTDDDRGAYEAASPDGHGHDVNAADVNAADD